MSVHKKVEAVNSEHILGHYYDLEGGIQWTDMGHKGRQTSLQYIDDEDPWTSSVGKSQGRELEYTKINPYFKDTIFESIINQYKMSRTRLMWVGPYACYSMHVDWTPRLHIPLITNPECYFVFKQGEVFHLECGYLHYVDTTKYHTFMNCSDQHRLHLVGIVSK